MTKTTWACTVWILGLCTGVVSKAETLKYTSQCEGIRYNQILTNYPDFQMPVWSAYNLGGTRELIDVGGITTLHVLTYPLNVLHRYGQSYNYSGLTNAYLDCSGDGYMVSLSLGVICETRMLTRNRTDAGFDMAFIETANGSEGPFRSYTVGIDDDGIATSYVGSATPLRTNVLFSTVFPGFVASNQHVYTIWRSVRGLSVYVDGQRLIHDTEFSPNGVPSGLISDV